MFNFLTLLSFPINYLVLLASCQAMSSKIAGYKSGKDKGEKDAGCKMVLYRTVCQPIRPDKKNYLTPRILITCSSSQILLQKFRKLSGFFFSSGIRGITTSCNKKPRRQNLE